LAPKYDGLFRARVTFDYAAAAEDELNLAKVRCLHIGRSFAQNATSC